MSSRSYAHALFIQFLMLGFVVCGLVVCGPVEAQDKESRYQRYVEGIMRAYDKDRSGFLEESEMNRMRRGPGEDADTNQDSRISVAEYVKYLEATKRRSDTANQSSQQASRSKTSDDNSSKKASASEIRIFYLQHASSKSLVNLVQPLLGSRDNVLVADVRSNSIVVRGKQEDLEQIGSLIKRLDVKAKSKSQGSSIGGLLGGGKSNVLAGGGLAGAISSTSRSRKKPEKSKERDSIAGTSVAMALFRVKSDEDVETIKSSLTDVKFDDLMEELKDVSLEYPSRLLDTGEFWAANGRETKLVIGVEESVVSGISNTRGKDIKSFRKLSTGASAIFNPNIDENTSSMYVRMGRTVFEENREDAKLGRTHRFEFEGSVECSENGWTSVEVKKDNFVWLLIVGTKFNK